MSTYVNSSKLNDMSIRAKLIVLILVPILGMVSFSVHEVMDHFEALQKLTATNQLMRLSKHTDTLVYELQKERGFSSGYINARGKKFHDELSAQRGKSDAEFKKLAEFIAANPATAASVKSSLDAAAALWDKLQDTRARIDSFAIEGKDSYAFYTAINSAYLEILASTSSSSGHPEMMRVALANYFFSKAVEEIGKERATLNAVLVDGKFNDENYRRIFAILASENSYLEKVETFGSPAIISAVNNAARSEQFRRVEGLRNAILSKGMAGGSGIAPEEWFDASTAKIDIMQAIGGDLSIEMMNFADELSQTARQDLILNVIMTAFLAILALVLSLLVVNSITRPLAGLVEVLRDIANGKFDSVEQVNASRRKDEIGHLMQGVGQMGAQLKENLEQRQAAEDKIRDTLDTTVRIVGEYQRFVAEVSKGNLTQRVKLADDSAGTLGQLGADLNSMTESLASMASGTTEAINIIYSTLEQLQSAINAQSAGASEQATAVNQTTSSLEEIKSMSAQTLDKVRVLGDTAERSRRESEQGTEAVEQTIASMGAIRERVEGIAQTILSLSEQTQQIGEITAVVTNLAQQSKMLALNASIEAAKAGEAGKGFAVVAAEVRELAEQSQQSTAQVQKILQDIRHATDKAVMATEEGSKGVDSGVVSVQRSGEAMRQLSEVIRETALASQQIVAAVRQEAIGIDQVTLAMGEINKVTAQFVTSSQQSKASSADLRKVAERLRESVGMYKL